MLRRYHLWRLSILESRLRALEALVADDEGDRSLEAHLEAEILRLSDRVQAHALAIAWS